MKLTLKSRKHLGIVVVSSFFMVSFAILLPTILIPGNSVGYQISLFTWDSALLTILFSVLFGISMGMHSYASDNIKKFRKGIAGRERAGTGFLSMTGVLFAGKLCPMCLAAIFGFLGLGASAVLFVLSFTVPILIVSLLLIIASLYFAGKRISRFCENCKV